MMDEDQFVGEEELEVDINEEEIENQVSILKAKV